MLNDGGGGAGVGECVVEVKVEVEWMDDVSAENPTLLIGQHSAVMPIPPPHRHLKEVQSTGCIQDLLFLYF